VTGDLDIIQAYTYLILYYCNVYENMIIASYVGRKKLI
jgi:hypothetical protein